MELAWCEEGEEERKMREIFPHIKEKIQITIRNESNRRRRRRCLASFAALMEIIHNQSWSIHRRRWRRFRPCKLFLLLKMKNIKFPSINVIFHFHPPPSGTLLLIFFSFMYPIKQLVPLRSRFQLFHFPFFLFESFRPRRKFSFVIF